MLRWLKAIIDRIFRDRSSVIELSLEAPSPRKALRDQPRGPGSPNRPYDPDTGVRVPIDAVHMTLDGWFEVPREEGVRLWQARSGAVLTLRVVSSAIPPAGDIEGLRRHARQIATKFGGGVVEAELADSPYGPCRRLIYKRLRDTGFVFIGMLWMPVNDHWLVWIVGDCESGTTGVREATITAEMFDDGRLTVEQYQRIWAADPYEPSLLVADQRVLRNISDDEQFDARFPRHPLSCVRTVLRELLTNVFADPALFPADGERSFE